VRVVVDDTEQRCELVQFVDRRKDDANVVKAVTAFVLQLQLGCAVVRAAHVESTGLLACERVDALLHSVLHLKDLEDDGLMNKGTVWIALRLAVYKCLQRQVINDDQALEAHAWATRILHASISLACNPCYLGFVLSSWKGLTEAKASVVLTHGLSQLVGKCELLVGHPLVGFVRQSD